MAEQLGKRGPFESVGQEAYLNLRRTHAVLSEPLDRLLKEHGLSQPLYNILRILRGHALTDKQFEGLPIQRIGDQMVSREPDMTRLIDRLVDNGLVERSRSAADRRKVLVRPTEAGLKIAERLKPAIGRIHADQFGDLSECELVELVELLGRARAWAEKKIQNKRGHDSCFNI